MNEEQRSLTNAIKGSSWKFGRAQLHDLRRLYSEQTGLIGDEFDEHLTLFINWIFSDGDDD